MDSVLAVLQCSRSPAQWRTLLSSAWVWIPCRTFMQLQSVWNYQGSKPDYFAYKGGVHYPVNLRTVLFCSEFTMTGSSTTYTRLLCIEFSNLRALADLHQKLLHSEILRGVKVSETSLGPKVVSAWAFMYWTIQLLHYLLPFCFSFLVRHPSGVLCFVFF